LTVTARAASSIKGAGRYGVPVSVEDLEPVDLVVAGSVAVSDDGARLGKGGGFSDLELAVAGAAGVVDAATRMVTTVHETQIVGHGRIPVTSHDVPVDLIVTPDRVIRCPRGRRRAPAIDWDALTDEKIESIPVLRALSRGHLHLET
jgi:5-formyltetrahydrofolate cyclo-ligase